MKIRSRGNWWRVVLVLAPLAALIALALATTGGLTATAVAYDPPADQYGGAGPIDPELVEQFGIGSDMLYVANGRASNVAVIDVATMEIVDYLPVPRSPINAAAIGGQAWTTLKQTLKGLNDTSLPYAVHDMYYWEVHGVVPSADRKSIYAIGALAMTDSNWTMYEVNAKTKENTRKIPMALSYVGYCGIEYDRNDENSNSVWTASMAVGPSGHMGMGGTPLKLSDPLAGLLPSLGLGSLLNNVESQLPVVVGGLSEQNISSGTHTRFMATDWNADLESSTCGIAWDKSGHKAYSSQMFQPLINTINWDTKQLTGDILPPAAYTAQAMHQSTSAKERGLLFTAWGPNGVAITNMNLNAIVGGFNMGQLGAKGTNIHGVEISPSNENILYVTGDGSPWGGTYVVDVTDIRAPKIIGGVEMGIDIAACGTYAIGDKENYYASSGVGAPMSEGAPTATSSSGLPIVGSLLGGSSGLPIVGDLLGGGSGLPIVGDVLGGGLPVVGDVLGGGLPVLGGGGLPLAGDLLGGGDILGLVLGLLPL